MILTRRQLVKSGGALTVSGIFVTPTLGQLDRPTPPPTNPYLFNPVIFNGYATTGTTVVAKLQASTAPAGDIGAFSNAHSSMFGEAQRVGVHAWVANWIAAITRRSTMRPPVTSTSTIC